MTKPSPPVVLVVDDEPRITRLLSIALGDAGFVVLTASGAEEALAIARERRPDLVMLDVVLPDVDGLTAMCRLREAGPMPVVLLSAKGSPADRFHGLELGADDYITKPFRPDDLVRRVRAVLRRASRPAGPDEVLRAGDVEIDLVRRIVSRRGGIVALGRTEWLLLAALAARPGRIVPAHELLVSVWGPDYGGDEAYLRVWIRRLERRLGASGSGGGPICSVEGGGYRLDVARGAEDPSGGRP